MISILEICNTKDNFLKCFSFLLVCINCHAVLPCTIYTGKTSPVQLKKKYRKKKYNRELGRKRNEKTCNCSNHFDSIAIPFHLSRPSVSICSFNS